MKNIILSLTESPYEIRYIARFNEKAKEMGLDSDIYYYSYGNLLSKFIPSKKIIKDELLGNYLKNKEHRLYEKFFDYALMNNANVVIPRVVHPELLYSTLISLKECPKISLSGYAFELFIRSASRSNIVQKILELDKISGLLLHTIAGEKAAWPSNILFRNSILKKIKLNSEPLFDSVEKFDGDKFKAMSDLNIVTEKKIVLFFGSMYPWKGPKTLLNAIKYLKNDFHFIFAGNTDTYNGDLNDFKKKNVTLIDKPGDEDMYKLYQACDTVICPYGATYEYGTSSVCMNAILASNK